MGKEVVVRMGEGRRRGDGGIGSETIVNVGRFKEKVGQAGQHVPGVKDLGGIGHCSSGGWVAMLARYESATVKQ